MTRRSYPAPNRSNAKTSGDLGSRTGELGDGRPFLVESWYTEGITLITCFFSVDDLENASPDELLAYLAPVLEANQVPDKFRRLDASDLRSVQDANGHRMYSVSFVVSEPD
jgi:hypothetical protein